MQMQLRFRRWLSTFDFRELSHLDGSLTKLVRKYALHENDAMVVTSIGWHRLRIIAVMGQKPVMIIPETGDEAPLETLTRWVAESLRDGVVCLDAYKKVNEANRRRRAA